MFVLGFRHTCVRTAVSGSYRSSLSFSIFFLLGCLFACVPSVLTAAEDEWTAQEIQYAETLTRMGYPDFADVVLQRVKAKGSQTNLNMVDLRRLVAMGEFDKALAMIPAGSDPNSLSPWEMRVTIAEGMYAWGKYEQTQKIMDELVKILSSSQPEDLKKFCQESVYKYAQMLILMNQGRKAISTYDRLIASGLELAIERQIKAEMCELYLRFAESGEGSKEEALAGAEKIANQLVWRNDDIWFGKAIVVLAHVKMLRGDSQGALDSINYYAADLNRVHDLLKEEEQKTQEPLTRHSPLAETRFLVGQIMYEQALKKIEANAPKEEVLPLLIGQQVKTKDAKTNQDRIQTKPGAMQHLANVFINYCGTKWAPSAGMMMRKIEKLVREKYNLDAEVKIPPTKMAEVEAAQFQSARALFNMNQFEEASEAYIDALTFYPETDMGISALTTMTKCFIELERDLDAEMVERHLAERFGDNPKLLVKAGEELLNIAQVYRERKNQAAVDRINQLFFTKFKKHPRTPGVIFSFGDERLAKDDFEGALKYYNQVVTDYPKNLLFLDALSKIALVYNKSENKAEELKALKRFIEEMEKQKKIGPAYVNAKYRMAVAISSMGEKYIATSLKLFTELATQIRDEKAPPHHNEEDKARNYKILEGCLFQKARCYMLLPDPKDKPPFFYKSQAIIVLAGLVKDFPKSNLVPAALSQIGTLYVIVGKPDEAEKVLQRLQKDFPETQEAQMSQFMLGKSLLDLGMRDRAVEMFKKMFQGQGSEQRVDQLLTAGGELLKSGEYEIALQAFENALKRAGTEKVYLERAMMGKGCSMVGVKRYQEGIETLEQLIKQYPKTGFMIDANLSLSTAYSQLAREEKDIQKRLGLFNSAVKAVKKARAYEKTTDGKMRLDVEVGRLRVAVIKAEEQFGTAEGLQQYRQQAMAAYWSIFAAADEGDLEDKNVAKWLEVAIREAIPIMVDLQRWEEAEDACAKYVKLFPTGKYSSEIRELRNKVNAEKAKAASAVPASQPATAPAAK